MEGYQTGDEANAKVVEKNMGNVVVVDNQLKKQEETNRQLEADNVEMKESSTETAQIQQIAQETSNQVALQPPQCQAEERNDGIAEAIGKNKKSKIIIAGGLNKLVLNSVEMFDSLNRTWTRLQPMKERRGSSSSVVYNNEMIVFGGTGNRYPTKPMETLPLNDVEHDHTVAWENFPAELPESLHGEVSVFHNKRLIFTGGYNRRIYQLSARIFEFSLFPPHTRKLLASMRRPRCFHGAVLLGNSIVILGGRSEFFNSRSALSTILSYDFSANECTDLVPLPYAVSNMATVKCGDHTIMIIGGANKRNQALNKVLLYNVQTQRHQMLPSMKYKRAGCVAAVVGDTVIVMGGADGPKHLKSVESFRFDRNTWEDLPDMLEERANATAVAF